jgi:hypothetical protein
VWLTTAAATLDKSLNLGIIGLYQTVTLFRVRC